MKCYSGGYAWLWIVAFILTAMCPDKATRAQDIFVGDLGTFSIKRYNRITGKYEGNFAPKGDYKEVFTIGGMQFGPDGNLYVNQSTGSGNGVISRFDGTTGAFIDDFVTPRGGDAGSFAFGPDGDIYLSDAMFGLEHFDGTTGEFLEHISGGIYSPAGSFNPSVVVFGPDGKIYTFLGQTSNPFTGLYYPAQVDCFDLESGTTSTVVTMKDTQIDGLAFGPDGLLYVGITPFNLVSGVFSHPSVVRYDLSKNGFMQGPFSFIDRLDGGQASEMIFGPDGNLYTGGVGIFSSGAGVVRYNGKTGKLLKILAPADGDGTAGPLLGFALRVRPRITAPVSLHIFGVNAETTGPKTATITWQTSHSADSTVDFRYYDPGDLFHFGHWVYSSAGNSALVTKHSIDLLALPGRTVVYYKVKSKATNSPTITSDEGSFVTGDPARADIRLRYTNLRRNTDGSYSVDILFSNVGSGNGAHNFSFQYADLAGVAAKSPVLPLKIGTLFKEGMQTVVFPASVGNPGNRVWLDAGFDWGPSGIDAGGAAQGNWQVTLP